MGCNARIAKVPGINEAAQRLALAASGRDADKVWKRNSAEAWKTAKNAANPTCRLHAVLGAWLRRQSAILERRTAPTQVPVTILLELEVCLVVSAVVQLHH